MTRTEAGGEVLLQVDGADDEHGHRAQAPQNRRRHSG